MYLAVHSYGNLQNIAYNQYIFRHSSMSQEELNRDAICRAETARPPLLHRDSNRGGADGGEAAQAADLITA